VRAQQLLNRHRFIGPPATVLHRANYRVEVLLSCAFGPETGLGVLAPLASRGVPVFPIAREIARLALSDETSHC
jgi:hypothetical protein